VTALLDTHAFVWALTEPERLSVHARDMISDPAVTLLVSAATAWEISIKHRSGRWPEVAGLMRQYDRMMQRLGASHLPLSSEHTLAAGSLEWSHADPFDRALAAQAMREGVQLISKDAVFSGLPGLTCLW
jgi:PIN domain nuclease of toxin-antitoxin system